ncbi:MAG: radical SAM protein, partial [Deferrisomatales bacterium]
LGSVSPDLPWHVSGFFPTYQLTDAPPTPAATLEAARRIGLEEGLRYVYTGNRPGAGGEDTACAACGCELLTRRGFAVTRAALDARGRCGDCGEPLRGLELGGTR